MSLNGVGPVAAVLGASPRRVLQEEFGRTPEGERVDVYTLVNTHGLQLRLMTFGATIVSLRVADREGSVDDVVLGFDSLAAYVAHSEYFGAVVGRYGNRIAEGAFTLDGRRYTLTRNAGKHHLHGGERGFDKVNWSAQSFTGPAAVGVTLRHVSPDGDEGYPGTMHAEVRYALHDDDRLDIAYAASSDHPTPVNLTQHSYVNLAGHGNGDVRGHRLTVFADEYIPIDSDLIPLGAPAPVTGTPFDFRAATEIGARIDLPVEQLAHPGGYDHTFVLRGEPGRLKHAARLEEPRSGRTLDVHTTEPGVQFYSGNFLDGSIRGKGGCTYGHRSGLCLETQHFPDSPNQPRFPSTILRPGERYSSRTVLTFAVVR